MEESRSIEMVKANIITVQLQIDGLDAALESIQGAKEVLSGLLYRYEVELSELRLKENPKNATLHSR